MTLVLINRSGEPVEGNVAISHAQPLASADVYRFTADGPQIQHVGATKLPAPGALNYTLPPTSATVVRLTHTARS